MGVVGSDVEVVVGDDDAGEVGDSDGAVVDNGGEVGVVDNALCFGSSSVGHTSLSRSMDHTVSRGVVASLVLYGLYVHKKEFIT